METKMKRIVTIDDHRNLLEHKIKIDEYVELSIKIPEELDVIEFSSVLEKARKLMKLGEVSVSHHAKASNPYKATNGEAKLQEDKLILDDYEKNGIEYTMSKYHFKDKKQLYARTFSARKRLGVNQHKRKSKYDNIDITNIVKRIKAGEKINDVASHLHVYKKKLYDIVYAKTGKTITQIRNGGN
jgi:hypothetical protein